MDIIEIEYITDFEFSPEIINSYSSVIIDIFNDPINIQKYIDTEDIEITIIIALYYLSKLNKNFDEKLGINILLDLHNKDIIKASVILGVYYNNKKDVTQLLCRRYFLHAAEKNNLIGLSNLAFHCYSLNDNELFLKYMKILYELDPNNNNYYVNMALYKYYIEKNIQEYDLYIHKAIISNYHVAYYIYATVSQNIHEKIKYIINAIKIKIKKKYIELLKNHTSLITRTILLLKNTKYDKNFLMKLDDYIIDSNINIVNTNNKCPICMTNNDSYLIKLKCNHSLCFTCCSIKYNCVICNT